MSKYTINSDAFSKTYYIFYLLRYLELEQFETRNEGFLFFSRFQYTLNLSQVITPACWYLYDLKVSPSNLSHADIKRTHKNCPLGISLCDKYFLKSFTDMIM